MNEHQVETLLGKHGDEIVSRRKPALSIKREIAWKPILVAGMAVVAIGTFILLPRKAEAAPMDKMISAFRTTHYWTAQRWFRNGTEGPWTPTETETYLDGAFRIVAPKFKPNGLTLTIKSGFEYHDSKLSPSILKTRFKEVNWSKSYNDPLKQAIAYSKNFKGALVRKDGIQFKGSEAYSLSVAKKSGRDGFTAIVRKDTNLPLQFTISMEANSQVLETKWEYRYDQPNEMRSLEPDQTKKIIDVEQDSKKLAENWGSIKPEAGGPTILSSSISKNGTIWIAAKVPGDVLSKGWRIVSLDDSNYVCSTYTNLNVFKKEDPLGSVLREVVVTEFVPVYDMKARPKDVTIRFGPYHTFAGPGSRPPRSSVKTALTDEEFIIPSYYPTVMLDVDTDSVTNQFWSTRAQARRAKGDFKGAIECYLKCDEIERTQLAFVNPSYRPLRAAAECYEKLGDHETAQKLRKLIPISARTQN